MFFCIIFGTVKNIGNKTLTFKFKRKRILLSEKSKNSKTIGYARATHNEYEYLEEQIKILKAEGCSLVFSEFISLDEEIKPQLNKAMNCLSRGDQFIITQLDRDFKNKKECLRTINKLINSSPLDKRLIALLSWGLISASKLINSEKTRLQPSSFKIFICSSKYSYSLFVALA